MPTIEIPLNSRKYPGLTTTVDEDDFDLVSRYRWCPLVHPGRTYVTGRVNGGMATLHRLLMGFPDEVVDHKDGNPLNNSRSNLRLATKSQNMANSKRMPHNTSGHKGVSWHKLNNRWAANVTVNGLVVYLGQYKDIEDAIDAYAKAAKEYFGEFARTE